MSNNVTLIGNLTMEPELRFTPSGVAMARIGIAVNRRFQRDGEWQEQTSFFYGTVWREQAEHVAESLQKGTRVIISGRMEQRTWEDTHKTFYFAMRAAHVDEKTAKIMYGSVYLFGPRWGPGTAPGQRNASFAATPEQQETVVKELQELVEQDNPDLDSLLTEAKRMGAKAAIGLPRRSE